MVVRVEVYSTAHYTDCQSVRPSSVVSVAFCLPNLEQPVISFWHFAQISTASIIKNKFVFQEQK